MTTAYLWKGKSIIRLGAFLAVSLMAGCASDPYRRPCELPLVRLHLETTEHIQTICGTLAFPDPEVMGQATADAQRGFESTIRGCALWTKAGTKSTAEVYLDSLHSLKHEVEHLLDAFCRQDGAHAAQSTRGEGN